ncbi:mitochondrial carrier protein [Pseudoscourfieldia marina]
MILPSHAYVGAAAVGTTAASYSAYKNKKIRTKPGAARAQRRLARPVVNGSMGAVGGGIQPLAMIAAKKTEEKPKPTMKEILQKAGKRALGGGLPGAAAMVVQVMTLMWLRTTVNYQYANGTTTLQALKTLYADGGIPRFYKGLVPALFQGPLSRFGDTAANAGMLALLQDAPLPMAAKTLAASFGAGVFRVFLMPIDTLKTTMQVAGKDALPNIASKIKAGGPGVLYAGWFAAMAATWVGHYPWFVTHNYLDEKIKKPAELAGRLYRAAFIGWCSSFVSDCTSNSIRVIKTKVQTSKEQINMLTAVKQVLETDGVYGLFTRGLGTKLVTNGLQGIMFTVAWKYFQEEGFPWAKKTDDEAADKKNKKDKK